METKTKTVTFEKGNFHYKAESRTFTGYASVFDVKDYDNDIILPGAYAGALKSGRKPMMFFNHQSWEVPVGAWKALEEDSTGLLVEGKLNKNEQLGAALENEALDGLSVGILIDKDGYTFDQNEGVSYIKNIAELREISIVNYPANPAARVDLESVKGIDGIQSWGDFENCLREVGGFSRGLAKAMVSQAKSITQCDAGDSEALRAAKLDSLLKNFRLESSLNR